MTSIHPSVREKLDATRALAVPIKELTDADRELLLRHLIGLGAEDRYLRFGSPLSDSTITSYVDGINFKTDAVFGVFDDNLELVAAGHFAPSNLETTDERYKQAAEFGLSVGETARGKGIGTALFVRSSTHARNLGIRLLFMHCLTQNKAMMRIARRAGMEISFDSGEAEAYVVLEPADASSVFQEAVQEQIAVFDYAVKRQILNAASIFTGLVPAAEAA